MGLETILHTKLIPPPLRQQRLLRQRLDEKVAQALHAPLTLVSAPAGFGKTTAVSAAVQALAAAGDASLAWLSLDAQDNEPLRFWRYFLTAVETAVSLPNPLAGALSQPQPPPIRPLLAGLLNQLAAQPAALLLVLDDGHLITDDDIYAGLDFLLAHAPPNLHLLLITRVDPPLPLHRLRANGRLLELRAADLRFDIGETAAFMQQFTPAPLTAKEIDHLHRQTEGWAAGLQLAALALPAEPAQRRAFIHRLAHSSRYIPEYLAEEVLDHQPPPLHAFLLQTAVLDRLCAPLCDAVTQRTDSQTMLQQLAQRNLFITPLGSGAAGETAVDWYRYHHLFAALLQGHLRRQQPAQIPALHRRAAAWFAAHNDVETALAHALAAPDFELAARLLESHADAIVMQGRARLIETWLARLPAAQTAAMPRANLAFARALLLRGRFAEVEAHLQQAEPANSDPAFQGEIHALRATLADTQGQPQQALRHARQAIAAVPDDNLMAQAMAHFALAGALRETGDVAAAVAAYEQAIPLCRAARLPLPEMLARAHLCFLCLLQGQMHRAAAAARPAVDAGAGHPATAAAYLSLSHVYLEWNDLAQAERLLHTARALFGESGHNAAALQYHILHSRLLRAGGDFSAARQALEEAATLWARGAPAWLGPVLRHQQVLFWLAQDAPATAVQLLDQADDNAPGHVRLLLPLARARIDLHQGAPQTVTAALALLQDVEKTAVAQGLQAVVMEARVLRALARAAQGDHPAALADLRHALTLAKPEGVVRLFVEAGAPLAGLLAASPHPYAAAVLEAFPAAVRAGVTAVSPLPDPLTEREREVLAQMARGLTYRQIADELVVSVNTVRHHVKGLYGKLAVGSRAQAVEKARELGLL